MPQLQTHEQQSTAPVHDRESSKVLTFFLDSEEYGLEILAVREIIGLVPVTTIPRAPRHIRGFINRRGTVIPVVDLRRRFGLEPAEDSEETCIVVVRTSNLQLGLVVDQVSEVMDLPAHEIVDPPSVGREISTDILKGIGKHGDRVTLLLDLPRIFRSDDFADLEIPG